MTDHPTTRGRFRNRIRRLDNDSRQAFQEPRRVSLNPALLRFRGERVDPQLSAPGIAGASCRSARWLTASFRPFRSVRQSRLFTEVAADFEAADDKRWHPTYREFRHAQALHPFPEQKTPLPNTNGGKQSGNHATKQAETANAAPPTWP
jgi:hypothetical protein